MKVLAVLSRFPWPLEKGDKLRAYYQLEGLAKSNEVHLVCLSDVEVPANSLQMLGFCASVTIIPLPKWKSMLNVLGGFFDKVPFQVHYFRSPAMKAAIGRLVQQHKIDIVFVQLIRLGMNLPEIQGLPMFLDYMDTFSIGMENRQANSNMLMRPIVAMEARRLKRYEGEIAARFQGLSVISERDADALPSHLRSRLSCIANGVGEQFFEPISPRPEIIYDLVFFGNMGYHPNVQSAKYLVEEVLPALRKLGLDPRVCLAGARPSPLIQSYSSDKITVTGFVHDIRVPILQSRLAIAPVIAGQGMQNKLLESMAMGIPTLTTPLAHAAVPAAAGKEVIVCATPESLALEIKRLLSDPVAAQKIGQAGKEFVMKNYRWKEMNHKLEAALALSLEQSQGNLVPPEK
jgi:hypothetical protein